MHEEMGKECRAIVQRVFMLAARRLGSAEALSEHLGLTATELRPYLAGDALPPEELLLRTVDIVIDDLKTIRNGFSEQAWRALSRYRGGSQA